MPNANYNYIKDQVDAPVYANGMAGGNAKENMESANLLDSFLTLNENRNGYGAKKFDSELISTVKKMFLNLTAYPKFFLPAEVVFN